MFNVDIENAKNMIIKSGDISIDDLILDQEESILGKRKVFKIRLYENGLKKDSTKFLGTIRISFLENVTKGVSVLSVEPNIDYSSDPIDINLDSIKAEVMKENSVK